MTLTIGLKASRHRVHPRLGEARIPCSCGRGKTEKAIDRVARWEWMNVVGNALGASQPARCRKEASRTVPSRRQAFYAPVCEQANLTATSRRPVYSNSVSRFRDPCRQVVDSVRHGGNDKNGLYRMRRPDGW